MPKNVTNGNVRTIGLVYCVVFMQNAYDLPLLAVQLHCKFFF
jgi:hypothetical protein